MRTQRTALSFLTESKCSHVGITSMRRVAITLLVMLLTSASALAQNYWLNLDPNYEGGESSMVPVSSYAPTIKLTKSFEPTREGYGFLGWSTTPTGYVEYKTDETVTLTGNLTLYAVWDSPYAVGKIITIGSLNYKITKENPEQVDLSGYEGNKPTGTLNIPSTVTIDGKEYSVTSIGKNAFDHCTNLTSVTISDGVTSIGDNAFYGCYDLTSVDIPNSVTNIGDYAFSTCTSLYAITFPNMVKSIGRCAFESCGSLKSVDIPDSVTSIGDQAFKGCGNLKSVDIPDGVTSIGKQAFLGCYSLESVTIPNSVTSIGNETFRKCYSLQSVTILDGVTSIGNETFRECKSLTSVTIPNSVTSIGNLAFSLCENLQSVTINGNP